MSYGDRVARGRLGLREPKDVRSVNHWRGQRLYDPRTGRYVGRFVGYYGSAYYRVETDPRKLPVKVRRDKVDGGGA